VIIPSRHERWLSRTIADIFQHAVGDIEVIACLDGYLPDPPLPVDQRIVWMHHDQQIGMRDGINAAARVASGEFLLKCDGHVSFSEGFDAVLKADCDTDWVVVPRRMSLDVETWSRFENGKQPVDQHYLSYPFERPGDIACGLHGNVWPERAKRRLDIPIDEEMSSQGSCWFLRKAYWDRHAGPYDTARYGSTFHQEFQELGLKVWLGGGQVMVNKRCHYLHLHKGKTYGTGYQYSNAEWKAWAAQAACAKAFTIRYWMLDQWQERTHDLRWLLERFGPIPGWPDLDTAFRTARERLAVTA